MEGLSEEFAKYLEAKMRDTFMGSAQKQHQRAIRVRGNGFETVDLDDAGNVIEPPPRCCYGTVLHAPNCKFWMTCT